MDMLEHITKEVCGYYKVGFCRMTVNTKAKKYQEPRSVLAYLIRKYTGMTFAQIADYLNQKHHSTILTNVRVVGSAMDEVYSPVAIAVINISLELVEKLVIAVEEGDKLVWWTKRCGMRITKILLDVAQGINHEFKGEVEELDVEIKNYPKMCSEGTYAWRVRKYLEVQPGVLTQCLS